MVVAAASAVEAVSSLGARERLDLGELFDREAPDLLRMVERMIGPGPQVEDVVQEAFLVAHRKGAIQTSVAPRAWLFRTALNIMRHHRRGLARRSRLAEALYVEPTAPSPQPDEAVEQKQLARAVRSSVRLLPHKLREVFVLFELEGMSGREVACVLQIPEATVHTRLHQARRRFKEAWERRARREECR
jgi:RNA polymerase sigma-70 factor (ECF subfamily)